ncbi:MAG: ATP-binding protein [Fidelibacterota bacterium]
MNYLNPITLKFQGNKKHLEQKFLDYYLERKIYQQRVALVLGTILYLLFSFLDVLMIPEKSHLFLGMRFFIVMPAALFTLALSFQKIYKKISQPALFVTNFVCAVVIIIMIIIAHPPVTYLYYAGEIIVIIFAFTFSGLRFIWSLALSILIILIYQASAIYNNTPLLYIINNNFFFISANFLSLTAAYIIESTMRNDFLQSILLQKEKDKVSELNKNLEKKVTLRTKQLELTNQQLQEELAHSHQLRKEQKKLQNQLIQSQKMEAIGQLAGGVAHDFNNLLTVINGYADIIMYTTNPDHPLYEPVEQILEAGKKAADLTTQLLAFSRKQLLHPAIIDSNILIKNFEKMLSSVVKNDNAITFKYSDDPININIDSRQIEQVLLNLVLNAKDAIQDGGTITIEVSKITINDKNASNFPKDTPADYAMISVRDSGAGMDRETIDHIFDPFYTTKEMGKGTGLGLSTVFGIIVQSKGNIYVTSEKGIGTEFRITFPLVESPAKLELENIDESEEDFYGKGLILIIEDNQEVKKYVRKTLNYFGYDTLEAKDYHEAAPIFEKLYFNIDLVISDVMLPGVSGEKIIETFLKINQYLKYILISGYTDSILDNKKHISRGNFIQKPFSREQLMEKVKSKLSK